MLTANDSPGAGPLSADRTPFPMTPQPPLADRVAAVFDKLWPHVAAWGLAALLAFFAVRERITVMEGNTQRHGERIQSLEQAAREWDQRVRTIQDDTTRIRTILEIMREERAEDRRYRREREQ